MIKDFSFGGRCNGKLSLGCEMCIEGRKSVIFVTGHCNADCFYCPVSNLKMHKPDIYVNERYISGNTAIKNVYKMLVEEITLSNSWGASLTGGDPLISPERCYNFAKLLKDKFGPSFHLHLYTPGREGSPEIFEQLSQVIDEIRFHPRNREDLSKLKQAMKFEWDVGLELVAVPNSGNSKWFKEILETYVSTAKLLKRSRIFLNLNELESTETNFYKLVKVRLISEKDAEINITVPRSKEEALEIIDKYGPIYPELSIYYCPAAEKDTIQLPNRLWQRAQNVKLPSDIVENESVHRGLLIRGIIRKKFSSAEELLFTLELEEIRHKFIKTFLIPAKMITVDYQKQQLLTSAEFLDEFSEEIKEIFPDVTIGIVEEYPTIERLQTSYIPL